MIVRKIVFALVAASAILAASAVMVFAAAFALYAWVRVYLGPAGAAAAVCAGAGLLIAVVALAAGLQASQMRRAYKRANGPDAPSLVDQVIGLARERPIVSAGAVVAAAALAVRNPAVLVGVVKTLLNQKRPSKPKS
ncbi:MAG TPA: hypothetical protein VMU59_05900 [Caulobacteraceae bacterium]|nr:hypothetical protein [Caulobacteraceae bacterium]